MLNRLFLLQWQNYLDIVIVASLIYSVYIWLRGTRAFHIMIGLAGLGLLYFLAQWSGLFLTSWLFQYLWAILLVLVIVIFQPEIRQLLEKASPLAILKLKGRTVPHEVLSDVVEACVRMADRRIGALIVFPRVTPVSELLQDGIPLDGLVSEELLLSIFQNTSPIHDGAVVVEKNRVVKAGCYLPLSTREGLPPRYGTRHRAALGLTEQGDAVCVVVSEERGMVSFVHDGEIEAVAGAEPLKQRLEQYLLPQPTQPEWTWVRASLFELLHRNLAAKFLALGLSCLLWFLLVGQQYSETFVNAKLEYQNVPPDLDIVSASMKDTEVQVRVRGPRGSISTLRPDQIRVQLNLASAHEGLNTIPITDDNLSLPLGMEATAIDPKAITMKFDKIVSRRFPVRFSYTGQLREGLQLASVAIQPETVELRGPVAELNLIQRVTTVPIDLAALTESRTIPCKVQISPQHVYSFRTSIPEVMVSISLNRPAANKPVSQSRRRPVIRGQRSVAGKTAVRTG
ncbi:MAG: TIGR00159 family protein [Candidatus Latescibacteria bacterium]|nr:TIGR00159 family protein [Candidatus Latescibacterota bacterium]